MFLATFVRKFYTDRSDSADLPPRQMIPALLDWDRALVDQVGDETGTNEKSERVNELVHLKRESAPQ